MRPVEWLARIGVLGMIWICGACWSVDHDARAVEASLADETVESLAFYATHSPITDPGEYARLLQGVPRDVPGIIRVVQGVLLQEGATEIRGHPISKRRVHREVNISTVRDMLARIAELDSRPLNVARAPAGAAVGPGSQGTARRRP